MAGEPKPAAEKPKVKITQQFREAHNMTYELDCSGSPLIVRVFPISDAEWRVEARTSAGDDAVVVSATASTRAHALEEVAAWWRNNTAARALTTFDWTAVAQAMSGVRAI